MTYTYTTLFEIAPIKGCNPTDCFNDYFTLKGVLSQLGFETVASTSRQPNNRQELGDIVSECFSHHESSLSIFASCCKDCITLDLNEKSSSNVLDKHREFAERFHFDLGAKLRGYTVKRVPTIVRGRDIWQYCEFGDGRITENDIKEILFDETSEYQRVTIAKTQSHGNVLFLDWLENLSEGDYCYTSSLCGFKQGITYEDKTVLILGGGDGAALECLRKLNPRMITMIEIDEVVMRACRTHLRSCCGDSLDQYEGDNYKIIVGDCLDYLAQYVKKGRKFDYIISDITDVPIETGNTTDNNSEEKSTWNSTNVGWKFFKTVFNHCLKLLENDGRILTHVTATSNAKGIKGFQKTLKELDEQLTYEMINTFVPSFGERWEFCHMRKSSS